MHQGLGNDDGWITAGEWSPDVGSPRQETPQGDIGLRGLAGCSVGVNERCAADGPAAIGHRGRAPGHRRDDAYHGVREGHGTAGVPPRGPPVRHAVPDPDEAESGADSGVQVPANGEAVDLSLTSWQVSGEPKFRPEQPVTSGSTLFLTISISKSSLTL